MKTTRKITCLTLMLPLLGLINSCSSIIKVTNDYDHTFNEFKTFGVYVLNAQQERTSPLNLDRIIQVNRAPVSSKVFWESDNPDLKINVVSILKEKTAFTANSDFYGYGGMYRPYVYWRSGGGGMINGSKTYNTYNYIDGSLAIDFVSTNTQKLVWQGIRNAEIDHKPDNPDEFIESSKNNNRRVPPWSC